MKRETTNKRFFIALLIMVGLFASNIGVTGLPPTTFSGFLDSVKTVAFNFFAPNNQVTKTSLGQLIETGNNNLLKNPSFESVNLVDNWNAFSPSPVLDTVEVIHGKQAVYLDGSSNSPLEASQDTTLYAGVFDDGTVQGLAMARVRASSTVDKRIYVCSRKAGVSDQCVEVQRNGKWGLYKVPFILGGTSNGIEVKSENYDNVTAGEIYVDDMFMGPVDLKADSDASTVEVIANIGGASPSVSTIASAYTEITSASFDMVVTKGSATIPCSGTNPSTGLTCSAGSESIGVVYSVRGGGTEEVCFDLSATVAASTLDALATFQVVLTANSSQTILMEGQKRIKMGGNSSGPSDTETYPMSLCGTFPNLSAGTKTFRLMYEKQFSNALIINASRTASQGQDDIAVVARHYGSAGTYTSNNADTDWASCGHTTSDFTGFGTVSSIETMCKRVGSDLLMKGKFVSGTSTATEARLSLKLNGVTLTSASTGKIPSLQVVGIGAYSGNGAYHFTSLIEPSVTYMTFGIGYTSNASLTKAQGSAIAGAGASFGFEGRFPIQGWDQSNIIIGQFNGLESCTDSYECTDTYTAKTSGVGTVSDENIEWITGNAVITSTSTYTMTFKSGVFTTSPNCTATMYDGNSNANIQISAVSASSISVITAANGTLTARAFNISCARTGADYVGKTAKAVASDQNVRTTGVLKAVIMSAKVTSAGVVSNEYGDLFNGNCSLSATSNFDCTFTSGIFSGEPNCSCSMDNQFNGTIANTNRDCQIRQNTSTEFDYYTAGGGASTVYGVRIICHGVSP